MEGGRLHVIWWIQSPMPNAGQCLSIEASEDFLNYLVPVTTDHPKGEAPALTSSPFQGNVPEKFCINSTSMPDIITKVFLLVRV